MKEKVELFLELCRSVAKLNNRVIREFASSILFLGNGLIRVENLSS